MAGGYISAAALAVGVGVLDTRRYRMNGQDGWSAFWFVSALILVAMAGGRAGNAGQHLAELGRRGALSERSGTSCVELLRPPAWSLSSWSRASASSESGDERHGAHEVNTSRRCPTRRARRVRGGASQLAAPGGFGSSGPPARRRDARWTRRSLAPRDDLRATYAMSAVRRRRSVEVIRRLRHLIDVSQCGVEASPKLLRSRSGVMVHRATRCEPCRQSLLR